MSELPEPPGPSGANPSESSLVPSPRVGAPDSTPDPSVPPDPSELVPARATAEAAPSGDTSSQDESGAQPEQDDPLQALRASLGLPERRGGTPINADLEPILRKGGYLLLGLGTVFLALWRILTWLEV